ncbi:hypothetical protein GCM10017673_20520 [Streptosporangium violaceochromogenes]|nr:hypothetical protein GCM10017673_20520 [Streptosporangium violaceochromogenes]
MTVHRLLPAGLLAVVVAVSAGACGAQPSESGGAGAKATAPGAASAPASPSAPADAPPLTITDPWVKTTRKGMTAAFGTLVNNTDVAMTVVSGSTPLSPKVELHEVVDSGGKMIMRPKEGGFVVPARGTHPLQPGGDHIMLMGVTKEVKPGAQVAFTLTLQGGESLEFTAVGKDFAGGREDYRPGTDGHTGAGHG